MTAFFVYGLIRMRFWQAIVASTLIHAVLLKIPIGMSSIHEVECVEMHFVIEVQAAAQLESVQPAPLPVRAAVQPSPETPPETVKAPEIPQVTKPLPKKPELRPKAKTLQKPTPEPLAEPVQPFDDTRPADVSMPMAAPPLDTVAADDPGKGVEMSAGGREEKQTAAVPRGHGAGQTTGSAVFGDSGGPGFISRVLPRYPRLAREMGREGTVVLSLTIDEHGVLKDVEVIESTGFGFDEEALRAIRASTFRAAVRKGKPVASRAILPVRFMLRGSGDD